MWEGGTQIERNVAVAQFAFRFCRDVGPLADVYARPEGTGGANLKLSLELLGLLHSAAGPRGRASGVGFGAAWAGKLVRAESGPKLLGPKARAVWDRIVVRSQ